MRAGEKGHAHQNRLKETPITPHYRDGLDCIASAFDGGAEILKLDADRKHFSLVKAVKGFSHGYSGAIEVDGVLYGATTGRKERARGGLDLRTAALRFNKPGPVSIGALTFAYGRLYCHTEKGEVALLEPTGDGMRLISKFTIKDAQKAQHFAHPVVAGGKLFIRNGRQLIAYSVK